MNYTVLALVTAAALISAATLATSIPTEADAKKGVLLKPTDNRQGCDESLAEPEKCDGFITQDGGTDDDSDEE